MSFIAPCLETLGSLSKPSDNWSINSSSHSGSQSSAFANVRGDQPGEFDFAKTVLARSIQSGFPLVEDFQVVGVGVDAPVSGACDFRDDLFLIEGPQRLGCCWMGYS